MLAGGGSGAICMEAIDKKTDEDCFIKLFILKKSEDNNEYDMSEFKNEINYLATLRFLFLLNLFLIFFFNNFYFL